jgi:hypothetical protein
VIEIKEKFYPHIARIFAFFSLQRVLDSVTRPRYFVLFFKYKVILAVDHRESVHY